MWPALPIYTNKSNFWTLEQALIQLWQPRRNTPFIYQFFSCWKGLIARSKFSSARQFGTFSLWRKLRWASTPQHVRRALHSPLFHRRVHLWEIIPGLGSNSVKRFHMEKKCRSSEIGTQGCYFIRRLANNLGEPQRSYAINAIDRALKFWKAQPVRKPTPLRAPWLLSPTWTRDLRKLLTSHTTITMLYPAFNRLLRASSSPSTLQSWTAYYAITRTKPHDGPMGNRQHARVQPCDHILIEGSLEVKLPTIWTVEKQR